MTPRSEGGRLGEGLDGKGGTVMQGRCRNLYTGLYIMAHTVSFQENEFRKCAALRQKSIQQRSSGRTRWQLQCNFTPANRLHSDYPTLPVSACHLTPNLPHTQPPFLRRCVRGQSLLLRRSRRHHAGLCSAIHAMSTTEAAPDIFWETKEVKYCRVSLS